MKKGKWSPPIAGWQYWLSPAPNGQLTYEDRGIIVVLDEPRPGVRPAFYRLSIYANSAKHDLRSGAQACSYGTGRSPEACAQFITDELELFARMTGA